MTTDAGSGFDNQAAGRDAGDERLEEETGHLGDDAGEDALEELERKRVPGQRQRRLLIPAGFEALGSCSSRSAASGPAGPARRGG